LLFYNPTLTNGDNVKALTLIQPWASLIIMGRKKIETRSWPTKYRGLLAIHAGKSVDRDACEEFGYDAKTIPRGAVLGIMWLWGCVRFPHPLARPDEYGDFHAGRYGFIFSTVGKRVFTPPVPFKGSLGLWEWKSPDDEIFEKGEEFTSFTKEIMAKHNCGVHQCKDYVRHDVNLEILGKDDLCKTCNGTGNRLFSMYQKCPDCNGEGFVLQPTS
jgi:activating signal cointegrator 1